MRRQVVPSSGHRTQPQPSSPIKCSTTCCDSQVQRDQTAYDKDQTIASDLKEIVLDFLRKLHGNNRWAELYKPCHLRQIIAFLWAFLHNMALGHAGITEAVLHCLRAGYDAMDTLGLAADASSEVMVNASRRKVLLQLVLDEDALPLASQQQQAMSSVAMGILLNRNWHGGQQADSREDIDDIQSILHASTQSASFQRKMIAVRLLHVLHNRSHVMATAPDLIPALEELSQQQQLVQQPADSAALVLELLVASQALLLHSSSSSRPEELPSHARRFEQQGCSLHMAAALAAHREVSEVGELQCSEQVVLWFSTGAVAAEQLAVLAAAAGSCEQVREACTRAASSALGATAAAISSQMLDSLCKCHSHQYTWRYHSSSTQWAHSSCTPASSKACQTECCRC